MNDLCSCSIEASKSFGSIICQHVILSTKNDDIFPNLRIRFIEVPVGLIFHIFNCLHVLRESPGRKLRTNRVLEDLQRIVLKIFFIQSSEVLKNFKGLFPYPLLATFELYIDSFSQLIPFQYLLM